MARELEIKVTVNTATAEAALGRTEKAMENLGKEATKTGTALGTTDKKFQEAGRGASDFDGAIRSLALKLTGGAVLMKGLTLLSDSLLAVGRGLAGIGLNALDMNASLEKSTLQFTTLMGDSAKAEAHVRSLFEFAKKTPFETGPIIAASKHLQLFGGDALNSQKTLTLLGDAAAASGANIEELSFWTGRMYAAMQAGKPFGEAAMRLTELGVLTPQARLGLENLAATGASAADTFDLFQTSLTKFTGAMDMQASTWEGLTSTIRDSVNLTIADALEPFFEFAKAGASVVADVLGSEGLQKTFNGLAQSIKDSLGSNTEMQVKTLLKTFVAFGEGVVSVSDIVVRALYGIKYVLNLTIEGFAQLMLKASESTTFFAALASLLPGVGSKFDDAALSLLTMRAEMQGLVVDSRAQRDAAIKGMEGNSLFGTVLDGTRAILSTMRQEIDKATLAQNQANVATNAGEDAARRLAEAAELDAKAMKARAKELEKFAKDMERFNNLSAQSRPIERIFDFRPDAGIKAFDELKKFQDSVKFFGLEAGKPWVTFKAAATKSIQDVVSSFDNFRGAFGNLGQTIVGAVQGGGNVVGSIGASLIGGLGRDLGQKLGTAIGGTLGTTLGSFGGPLGSIAGSLAGTLVGKLFGPSQQSQVTQMRNKFLDASGGLDTLRQRADAAGVSMAGLLNARSARQFESEVERLNAALKESEQRTQDTYAAMERWGLTITDLGPKFQQQDINKRLLSIMKDMELLTSAGAEFNTVAAKMGPEIGKLVQEAIEAGGTVPMELQPIIKKMIELGLLTDKNGDKFTELSQVPFAQNMNEQFGKLINKMDELISKFAAMTDGIDRSQRSAEHLSDTITGITPPTWLDQSPTFVGFDRGGVVGRTFARPSVRDTIPALLRPGEVVLTPEQVSGGLGRSTTAVAVTINVAGYLDSSTARASLADVVKTELSKQLRREGRAA